jgi:hypothetical protein
VRFWTYFDRSRAIAGVMTTRAWVGDYRGKASDAVKNTSYNVGLYSSIAQLVERRTVNP